MNTRLLMVLVVAIFAAYGCAIAPVEPLQLTPKDEVATSPVVREVLPLPVVPAPVVATTTTPNPEVSTQPPVQGAAPSPTAAPATETVTRPGGAAATDAASPIAAAPKTAGKNQKGKAPPKPAKQSARKPVTTDMVAADVPKGGRQSAAAASSQSDPTQAAGAPAADTAPPTLAYAAPGASSGSTPSPPGGTSAAVAAIPSGTLYICSATVDGKNQQTAIEFDPGVKKLCTKHPEMGVCQYEREACRLSGGRVYTAAGEEITKKTEAEYDKKVLRVRFRAG